MKQTSECNKKEADADIENKLAVTNGKREVGRGTTEAEGPTTM